MFSMDKQVFVNQRRVRFYAATIHGIEVYARADGRESVENLGFDAENGIEKALGFR